MERHGAIHAQAVPSPRRDDGPVECRGGRPGYRAIGGLALQCSGAGSSRKLFQSARRWQRCPAAGLCLVVTGGLIVPSSPKVQVGASYPHSSAGCRLDVLQLRHCALDTCPASRICATAQHQLEAVAARHHRKVHSVASERATQTSRAASGAAQHTASFRGTLGGVPLPARLGGDRPVQLVHACRSGVASRRIESKASHHQRDWHHSFMARESLRWSCWTREASGKYPAGQEAQRRTIGLR